MTTAASEPLWRVCAQTVNFGENCSWHQAAEPRTVLMEEGTKKEIHTRTNLVKKKQTKKKKNLGSQLTFPLSLSRIFQ